MTTEPDMVDMKLRLPRSLAEQIDARIKDINEKKPDLRLSRNAWFVNMATWVIERLPHEAVRSDLVAAWPDAPKETLGIDGR